MTTRLLSSGCLMVSAILVIVVCFGVGYAQDPTTPQEATPKVTKPKPQQRRAKSTPKTTPDTTTSAEATGDQTSTVTPQQPAAAVISSPTEQTDLSGTYAGTFNCDEVGLTGDTTITINGNQFTTADGKSGRIVAATTKGYTAVALQIGDEAATTRKVISLRGRKSGDKLTLTSVDAAAPCSFAPTRTIASRRTRRVEKVAPAAVGTEVASPAEAGPSPADVISAPPRKTKKNRSVTPKGTSMMPPAPAAVPTESPTTVPVTESNPEPSQTPRPGPRPSPSPSPTASPSPSPEASPSPSPSPSPNPSPSPAPKRP